MRIPFTAGAGVMPAIARVGRTEDVQLSPSGRRLALIGYQNNRVLVFEIRIDTAAEPPRVELADALEIGSASFDHPHGASWIDEDTLIVANRYGALGIVQLPESRPASGRVTLDPVRIIGGDRRDLVKYPGSVSAFPIGLGLVELLVCNNHVHHVSRHLIDRRGGNAVQASECLISAGLRLPDGVAHSRSGRWIAVSNHDAHCVFVFRNDDRLHEASAPDAVLRGVCHPHGLSFTPDETWILAADADAPVVHAFRSADANWEGEHAPVASLPIVDDATFERGRFHPGEGGPKGIDLTADGTLLVATCEEDPLVFFDLRPVLGRVDADADSRGMAAEADRAREFLLRYLGAARARVDEATEAIRRTSEQEIDLLLSSRWWRITAPFRQLSGSLQYALQRARHRLKRRTV